VWLTRSHNALHPTLLQHLGIFPTSSSLDCQVHNSANQNHRHCIISFLSTFQNVQTEKTVAIAGFPASKVKY
jgi:hypothetical protein